MAREDWVLEAKETLDKIYAKKPDVKDIGMLADLHTIVKGNEEKHDLPDSLPDTEVSKLPTNGVLDDFSVILSKYTDTRSKEDRDKMREVLKSQLAAIEKEIVEMRIEVKDPEAIQMFIDFKESLNQKI